MTPTLAWACLADESPLAPRVGLRYGLESALAVWPAEAIASEAWISGQIVDCLNFRLQIRILRQSCERLG